MLTFAQKVWKFEAWANQTTVHPAGLSMLGLCCGLILLASRRVATLAFFLFSVFVSVNQRVVVTGLDFDFIRILVLVTLFRIVIRGELGNFKFRVQDGILIAFVVSSSIAMVVRVGVPGLENRLGFALTSIGIYFAMRTLIRGKEDLVFLAKPLVLAMIPLTVFFMIEKATGRNPFAFLGGVPELTVVRSGRLRCQGAFAHPIVAGVFFAMLVPYLVGISLMNSRRAAPFLAGVGMCVLIIFATSSSTPVSALILGLIGWMFWKVRWQLSSVRWLAVVLLLFLHFAMEKGVWHLLARIDFVGGSTGWHRYHLIERAIANLDEWFLIGLNSTGHWGPGLYDVTNQFVLEGINGGLVSVILLIAIIVTSFVSVSRSLRAAAGTDTAYLIFGFGVMMFVHVCVFLSLSYFGQMTLLWFFTIAAIESLAEENSEPVGRRVNSMGRTAVNPRVVRAFDRSKPRVIRGQGSAVERGSA